MRLNSLQIKNFKNYQDLSVDFEQSKVLVLVGNNGQGKTNFLEAIVILALSKSFQSAPLKEMVNWYLHSQETGLPEYFHIKGRLTKSRHEHDLEVICGRTRQYPKTLKVDDVKVKAKDYVGQLPIVLFTPQDLNMVMLAPALRRRYVDLLISQVDRDYLDHLSHYQVVLKQRSKLLGQIQEGLGQADELEYWDTQLVEHGAYLLWKRREVFRSLNENLDQQYERISAEQVSLELSWLKQWEANALDQYHQQFADYITQHQQRDIHAGRTLGGPHREDFCFMMNDRDLSTFGSRGECRSALLALKLREVAYVKELLGEAPLVLFDDVFSELDLDRQKNLLELFSEEQVIITTTHLDHEVEGAVVWKVEDGQILE